MEPNCKGSEPHEDLLTTVKKSEKKNNHSRNSARKEKRGKTEKETGGQHHRMDKKDIDNVKRGEDTERWREVVADTVMALWSLRPWDTQDVKRPYRSKGDDFK